MGLNYAERVCPTFLSALTQGITVTAMGSLLFIVLYTLVNVACGCIKRYRRSQPLDIVSEVTSFTNVVKLGGGGGSGEERERVWAGREVEGGGAGGGGWRGGGGSGGGGGGVGMERRWRE